jgi:hypothetical protein
MLYICNTVRKKYNCTKRTILKFWTLDIPLRFFLTSDHLCQSSFYLSTNLSLMMRLMTCTCSEWAPASNGIIVRSNNWEYMVILIKSIKMNAFQ